MYQYESLLDKLLAMPEETEIVEFKEAKNDFSKDKLGQYFSALSNEANLIGSDSAWLVFGVMDKTHEIAGTNFIDTIKKRNDLKLFINQQTSPSMSFQSIVSMKRNGKRVIIFEIPAAPRGNPVSFNGHFYGREGESIVGLSQDKLKRIFSQTVPDWSAAIVPEATFDDLDPVAIAVAREAYKKKYPGRSEDVNGWDDVTFLNKAKLTLKGKITRTTLLLVGKDEVSSMIDDSCDPKIRLSIKDENGDNKDFCICTIPFILSVDTIANKIHNVTYQYLRDDSLIPETVTQFAPFIIREALCNCIAHQDYQIGRRIDVIEKGEYLTFINAGTFIPESVEAVVIQDSPEAVYRNKFLVEAMANVGMVETAGGGIKKMFMLQKQNGFPLPDYDLADNKVEVEITGKVVDKDFADILMKNTELSIEDVILLDRVSKKREISREDANRLRRKHLIEGRYPKVFLSKSVATVIGDKIGYTREKGLENESYRQLILDSIKKHDSLTKQEINTLVGDILPANLSDKQKRNRIDNLLRNLREDGLIFNIKSGSSSKWQLSK